jgi:hypothetical protein
MSDYDLELHLVIQDFRCTPEEITALLGLSPDRFKKEGDFLRGQVRAKRSYWWLESPLPFENSTVEEQWRALSDRLGCCKLNLAKLPSDADTELLFVVYARKYMPDVEIPVKVMRECAGLGLKVRIAIYDFVQEEENIEDGDG